MAFLINALLLAFWVIIIRASFKHQKWGAITIAILSAISPLLIIPMALERPIAILPSLLSFCLALTCSLAIPKN